MSLAGPQFPFGLGLTCPVTAYRKNLSLWKQTTGCVVTAVPIETLGRRDGGQLGGRLDFLHIYSQYYVSISTAYLPTLEYPSLDFILLFEN